jgi:hypothetical protein
VHGDAAGLAGFEDDGVRPFGEAIETLASWSASHAGDEIEAEDFAEAPEGTRRQRPVSIHSAA